MLNKILIDEVYKNSVLKEKYIEKRIKKISLFKIKKKKKHIFKKKNLFIAERKKFSPLIGLNKKFNKKRFINLKKENVIFFSKLTSSKFFKGSLYKKKSILLRKDFITSYTQILLTLIQGYNYILLIKKILSFKKLKNLCKIANFLGIIPLIELDGVIELKKIIKKKMKNIFLGINSRNLEQFKFNKKESFFDIKKKGKIIYESGIQDKNEMIKINNIGFKITLIGENLTKNNFYYEKNRKIHKKKNITNKKN